MPQNSSISWEARALTHTSTRGITRSRDGARDLKFAKLATSWFREAYLENFVSAKFCELAVCDIAYFYLLLNHCAGIECKQKLWCRCCDPSRLFFLGQFHLQVVLVFFIYGLCCLQQQQKKKTLFADSHVYSHGIAGFTWVVDSLYASAKCDLSGRSCKVKILIFNPYPRS